MGRYKHRFRCSAIPRHVGMSRFVFENDNGCASGVEASRVALPYVVSHTDPYSVNLGSPRCEIVQILVYLCHCLTGDFTK